MRRILFPVVLALAACVSAHADDNRLAATRHFDKAEAFMARKAIEGAPTWEFCRASREADLRFVKFERSLYRGARDTFKHPLARTESDFEQIDEFCAKVSQHYRISDAKVEEEPLPARVRELARGLDQATDTLVERPAKPAR